MQYSHWIWHSAWSQVVRQQSAGVVYFHRETSVTLYGFQFFQDFGGHFVVFCCFIENVEKIVHSILDNSPEVRHGPETQRKIPQPDGGLVDLEVIWIQHLLKRFGHPLF